MGEIAKTLFGGSESPEDQHNMPALLSQMLGGTGQPDQSLAPQAGEQDMVSKYLDRWNKSYPQPPNSPPTQAMASDEKPINIDGWKPHHRTTLGFLADALLSGFAGTAATPFANKASRDNMHEAMEGFTQDPENTIRRIAQFDPKTALALQERYTDNSRQQGNLDRQNELFDMKKEELVYGRVASMMQGANKDTWPKMRELALAIGNKYGVDASTYIPTDYDPDSIEFIRNGAIKPLDQKKLQQGDARIAETADHHDALENQAAVNEGGRNNRAATKEAGVQNRHDHPVARPGKASEQIITTMTKFGPGVISPDRKRMKIYRDGQEYRYLNINGTWVPQGPAPQKGQ